MQICKNQIHVVNIDSYNSQGDGVGRIDKFVVFVKNALIGEKLKVKILKAKKNYGWAKIEEIINISPARITPDCKFNKFCGGCSLRHMTYTEELNFKLNKVNEIVHRIAGLPIKITTIHSCKDLTNTYHYRNKSAFSVSYGKNHNIEIGMFRQGSHHIINIDECLIQDCLTNKILNIVRKWMNQYKLPAYDSNSNTGLIKNVFIRTNTNKDYLVCLVATKTSIPHYKELVKMLKEKYFQLQALIVNLADNNKNSVLGKKFKILWGNNVLQENICNLKFNISVPAFFQINKYQTDVLYNKALKLSKVSKQDNVLDLYCGIGTITLLFAKKCKCAIGVEIEKQAIKNAKDNAKINNVSNVQFYCGDSAKIIQNIKQEIKIDIICVDPPRNGLSKETINQIIEISPKKLVYISCDPATLARDLNIFTVQNYLVKNIELVDMFPRTYHVESICILNKKTEINTNLN